MYICVCLGNIYIYITFNFQKTLHFVHVCIIIYIMLISIHINVVLKECSALFNKKMFLLQFLDRALRFVSSLSCWCHLWFVSN